MKEIDQEKLQELEMALTAAILANNFTQKIGLQSQIRRMKSPISDADIMKAVLREKMRLKNG